MEWKNGPRRIHPRGKGSGEKKLGQNDEKESESPAIENISNVWKSKKQQQHTTRLRTSLARAFPFFSRCLAERVAKFSRRFWLCLDDWEESAGIHPHRRRPGILTVMMKVEDECVVSRKSVVVARRKKKKGKKTSIYPPPGDFLRKQSRLPKPEKHQQSTTNNNMSHNGA